MTCYQSTNLPSGFSTTGRTSYATEADCLQACKEGACCEGTTCTVKPQCQCQGAGKTFKGVGTTCTPNPCGRCGCTTGIINAQTITLSISSASFLFSPQDLSSVGNESIRPGGACVNDSSIIQWLNGIVVSLTDTTDPITGVQSWKGQAITQSHLSSVLVVCVLSIGCNGSASLTVTYCPDGANLQTCMCHYGLNDVWRFSISNPCLSSSGTVGGFFGQGVATFSGQSFNDSVPCRYGPAIGMRGFGLTYTINANPLP
jgi:hypothetical protein